MYAVVTGASQGLGRAFAEALAQGGWNLVLAALPGTGLPSLAREIEQAHDISVIEVEMDLATEIGRRRLLARALEVEGGIGLLVNNVGIGFNGLFDLIPIEAQHAAVEINIQSTMSITYGLLGRLAEAKGRILTVASLAGFYPMPLFAVYAATKSFLLNWSLALRHELEGLGVGVTVLAPGGIYTSREIREKTKSQGLSGRLSSQEPWEVAQVALRGAFKDKAIVIPGAFNRLLFALGGLVPKDLLASSIFQRWRKTLRKTAGTSDAAWFSRPENAA